MANTSTTGDLKHQSASGVKPSTLGLPSMSKKRKKEKHKIKPNTRLELSVNPSDGMLLTAPLSLIINAATDELYLDLETMVTGTPELAVPSATAATLAFASLAETSSSTSALASASASGLSSTAMPTPASAAIGAGGGGLDANADPSSADPHAADANNHDHSSGAVNDANTNSNANSNNNSNTHGEHNGASSSSAAPAASTRNLFTTKKDSMSNFSFQQRRHILASTLAKHVQSISHISALVASNLSSSGTASTRDDATCTTNNNNNSNNNNSSSKPQLSSLFGSSKSKPQDLYIMAQTPPENELSSIAITTSQALNHIRTSWVNADEAQDTLYFHHDTLWKIRNHPHDVKGALDVIMKGQWKDLSSDICLKSDGYRDSLEGQWDEAETTERLKCTIRRKLLLGEVGMFHVKYDIHHKKKTIPFWWNMVLEQNGTVVRLFYGRPFVVQKDKHKHSQKHNESNIYPIEARVTILSEHHPAPWTLLSIRLRTNVKTGESNHQLELNPEQMYRFHTLCDVAMKQEENRVTNLNINSNNNSNNSSSGVNNENGKDETQEKEEIIQDKSTTSTSTTNVAATPAASIVSRPLEKLLDMGHIFSLSWQLEILSSQADALRKGTWASRMGSPSTGGGATGGIVVSHVHFYTEEEQYSTTSLSDSHGIDFIRKCPLAVMAIHFWEVDDRNGRPAMGKLIQLDDNNIDNDNDNRDDNHPTTKSYLPSSDKGHTKRLTLEITAIPRKGLQVSISGGNTVMKNLQCLLDDNTTNSNSHLKRNAQKLLSSVQDPFQLSASDALLSAAVICAENRCHAVLSALLKLGKTTTSSTPSTTASSPSLRNVKSLFKTLPSWLHLSVECGSISVGVCISYHGKEDKKRPPVLLFRLACDSRTGCFIPSFPQSASLLRKLVCRDSNASEVQLLRQAKAISIQNAAASSNKRRSNVRREKELTGRMVRDAFQGLTRSIDILGRRVGVGGVWDDIEKKTSSALREKSITQACGDVRASLMICSGIAVVYSVAACAAAVASGVNPAPDLAGGPITSESKNGNNSSIEYVGVPPLAVVMNQQMIEEEVQNANGEKSIKMKLERNLCGMTSSISQESLTLHMFDISTTLESATDLAVRIRLDELPLELGNMLDEEDSTFQPQSKRIKVDANTRLQSLTEEAEYLVGRLNATWDN